MNIVVNYLFECIFTCISTGCKARWTSFHPGHWTTADVSEWLVCVCKEHSLPTEDKIDLQEAFAGVDGKRLITFGMEDFHQRTAKYGGMLRQTFKRMYSDVPSSPSSHSTPQFPMIPEFNPDYQENLSNPENISADISSSTPTTGLEESNWPKLHPSSWTCGDVESALQYICKEHDISQERRRDIVRQFSGIDGNQLIKMKKQDFRDKVTFEGDMLFHLFQQMFNVDKK